MSVIGDQLFDPENPLVPPVATDPAEIAGEGEASMREAIPGWTAFPTALDTLLIRAGAEASALARDSFRVAVARHFTELVGELFSIEPRDGAPARGTLTVNALDALGHVEPAGMSVYLGDLVLRTTEPLVVDVGESTGQVPVETVDATAAANGAVETDQVRVQIDALEWLATEDPVTLDGPLDGGEDPETLLDYQLRLIGELAVPRRAVRAEDFVFYARRFPAVGAAWAIPLYNADTATADVALTGTVVVTAVDGGALDPGSLTEILQDLAARTVEDLDLFVISPDYLPIDVTAEIRVLAGYDAATVLAEVDARIREVLDPLLFARALEQEQTAPAASVHVSDLVAAARYVAGVLHVTDLQIGDGSTDEIDLPDGITLPTPGTIDVTEAA